MAKSKIEWTEDTWNPIVGCSIVSPGCTNCYAMRQAARIESMGNAPQYNGLTKKVNGKVVWTGKMALAEKALLKPLKRRKPTTYFVNSMGDLFHEDVPDAWIDQVFAVMALCPQHTFQVLTKRADRMRDYIKASFDCVVEQMMSLVNEEGWPTVKEACKMHGLAWVEPKSADDWWPLPNVWLGVSAEDQTRADERIPLLLDTPAAIRFVSCEPLLGPVDLATMDMDKLLRLPSDKSGFRPKHTYNALIGQSDIHPVHGAEPDWGKLDWVIVGGESGPNARPMHPDWARGLRDQCEAAGTAFFFKQWGEWADFTDHPEKTEHKEARIFDPSGRVLGAGKGNNGMVDEGWEQSGGAWMARVGKNAAGRLLDGREWNGVPG